jgi:hypothetical protein
MLSTFSNSCYRLPPHQRECRVHGAQGGLVSAPTRGDCSMETLLLSRDQLRHS